jgi:type IV secretory pathway VirB2 component (pilin)
MHRKKSVFQAAMILMLLNAGLEAASNTPPAAQNTSPWEAAATCCVDSPLVGPVGQILSLLAIVVGGLVFAFTENQLKRMLAAIVFALE